MRIGIDGYPLSEPKTGIGHYTFELSRQLASIGEDELRIISPRPFDKDAVEERRATRTPQETRIAANLDFVEVRTNPLTRRWWSVGLPRYLRGTDLQLFHGTNYQIPLHGLCPSVVTFHDLSLLLHPHLHETRAVMRGRLFLPYVAKRARMIITPTESVRREVVERLGVAREKVVAIPEAPRDCFRRVPASESADVLRRLGVRDDFLLCVATLEPRKNLKVLLDAFDEVLRATDLRPQLVLVGREGWMTDNIVRRLTSTALGENLRWLGYVSDADLAALYSRCKIFIYPSLYEGFGLPPLEAMACGAPVIASQISSIAEVTGGDARLFSPADTKALTQAIVSLWNDSDERLHLSARGMERARKFTWRRTAELTREVYEQVISESR